MQLYLQLTSQGSQQRQQRILLLLVRTNPGDGICRGSTGQNGLKNNHVMHTLDRHGHVIFVKHYVYATMYKHMLAHSDISTGSACAAMEYVLTMTCKPTW
jgi:hypothetical protein